MTAGSRGDVAPYTGLAHGLQRAGHSVTLVTHASFAQLVTAAGVGFHPLPVDPRSELESARGRALSRSATRAGKLARLVALARGAAERMAEGFVTAARNSDVLLLSGSVAPLGRTVAAGLGLPSMGVHLQPLAPTGEFAPPVLGTRSWGRAGNLLAGYAVDAAAHRVFAGTVRATARRMSGQDRGAARAVRRAGQRRDGPVQHGFSPLVVPRPRDWRPGLTVAGYWWPYDPPGARLPARLAAFLAAGPPPVFVGLGSATVPDPERLGALLVRALRTAGLRGVVQRGWGGLHAEGDDMLTIDEVPHSLLFPRTAAVVHHAGAGTTAAGLRAGVPAVPVPVQFDEGFWAARLTALGVSPGPVPLRRITSAGLAAALLEATTRPGYRGRAAALAAQLRQEDGIRPVRAALDRLAGG